MRSALFSCERSVSKVGSLLFWQRCISLLGKRLNGLLPVKVETSIRLEIEQAMESTGSLWVHWKSIQEAPSVASEPAFP